jgi:hypothetical protein
MHPALFAAFWVFRRYTFWLWPGKMFLLTYAKSKGAICAPHRLDIYLMVPFIGQWVWEEPEIDNSMIAMT